MRIRMRYEAGWFSSGDMELECEENAEGIGGDKMYGSSMDGGCVAEGSRAAGWAEEAERTGENSS